MNSSIGFMVNNYNKKLEGDQNIDKKIKIKPLKTKGKKDDGLDSLDSPGNLNSDTKPAEIDNQLVTVTETGMPTNKCLNNLGDGQNYCFDEKSIEDLEGGDNEKGEYNNNFSKSSLNHINKKNQSIPSFISNDDRQNYCFDEKSIEELEGSDDEKSIEELEGSDNEKGECNNNFPKSSLNHIDKKNQSIPSFISNEFNIDINNDIANRLSQNNCESYQNLKDESEDVSDLSGKVNPCNRNVQNLNSKLRPRTERKSSIKTGMLTENVLEKINEITGINSTKKTSKFMSSENDLEKINDDARNSIKKDSKFSNRSAKRNSVFVPKKNEENPKEDEDDKFYKTVNNFSKVLKTKSK